MKSVKIHIDLPMLLDGKTPVGHPTQWTLGHALPMTNSSGTLSSYEEFNIGRLHNCRGYYGEHLFYIYCKNTKKIASWLPTTRHMIRGTNNFTPEKSLKEEHIAGKTYICFTVAKNSIKFLKNGLSWLNVMEKEYGFDLSILYSTQHEGYFIIEGDSCWNKAVWKGMLYSFFVKCMTNSEPEKAENFYWSKLLENKRLETFLKKAKEETLEIFDEKIYTNPSYPEKFDTWKIHENSGFYSICTGRNKPMADLLGIS